LYNAENHGGIAAAGRNMRLASQPLREFSHKSRRKIRIEFFSTPLDASAPWDLTSMSESSSAGTPRAPFAPGSTVKERKYDQATFRPLAAPCLRLYPSTGLVVRSSSRAIRLLFLEDLMIENKIDKAMKPIPAPYE
jgi:hypothetical protein